MVFSFGISVLPFIGSIQFRVNTFGVDVMSAMKFVNKDYISNIFSK
jgi:hypothetical protein